MLPGPTNLRNILAESRSVSLVWDPPDTTAITVQLEGYSVQVTGTGGVTSMSHTTNLNSPFIVIYNLFPYQQYECSVNAIYENDNIGEEVSIVVRTRQEGTSIILILVLAYRLHIWYALLSNKSFYCSSWNPNSHYHGNHPHPLLGSTS